MEKKGLQFLFFFYVLMFLISALLLTKAHLGRAEEDGIISAYFPNWNIYTNDDCQVKNLPWDRLDRIYHAFWKITKNEGKYDIVSSDQWADTDMQNSKAHFPQYEKISKEYPDTEILLSIGGWTYSGLFSEMALTKESRASFIQSCINTLNAYPFLDGIDLDWEYPGVYRKAAQSDEGCPVAGNDWVNYTLLLQEMKEALDQYFGRGEKLLTICASGGTDTLEKQNYALLHPHVDAINLMTYDLISSSLKTSHHSPLYGAFSTDKAVSFMIDLGVPAKKLFIGTPLYCHGWRNVNLSEISLVGAAADGKIRDGNIIWNKLKEFENQSKSINTPGWHVGYDELACAAYLWNDDPDSSYYRNFLSYENFQSLNAKLDYIDEKNLGGMIVWQIGGDDQYADFPMITQMHQRLHP